MYLLLIKNILFIIFTLRNLNKVCIMSVKYNQSRWYDKDPKAVRMFQLISDLKYEDREMFADNLLQVVNLIKNPKKEETSIGTENIHNYYQAFNKRRWYDRMPLLMRAMNRLGTLSAEDRKDIVEGILGSLDHQNKVKKNMSAESVYSV